MYPRAGTHAHWICVWDGRVGGYIILWPAYRRVHRPCLVDCRLTEEDLLGLVGVWMDRNRIGIGGSETWEVREDAVEVHMRCAYPLCSTLGWMDGVRRPRLLVC